MHSLKLENNTINKRTTQRLAELGIPLPFPDSLPDGIRCIESYDIARVWRVQRGRHQGLLVLADVAVKRDGKLWYHVSFSRARELPSYHDRAFIKQVFFGDDKWAIEVLPEKQKHVNFHPNCLHLWHCLEGRPFPEFSTNGMV